MLIGTVKSRVAKFRLRKERLTELAALAAVHGRASVQLAAVVAGAHAAVVKADLEVSCPTAATAWQQAVTASGHSWSIELGMMTVVHHASSHRARPAMRQIHALL
jgi:hypothetical protein